MIDDGSVLSTKAGDTILSIQMSLAAYAQNAAFTSDDQCMYIGYHGICLYLINIGIIYRHQFIQASLQQHTYFH